MNVVKKNSCSPKLLAITEKTGEVFQFAILALSGGGFPDTLLQRVHTACGIETLFLPAIPGTEASWLQRVHTACGIETEGCCFLGHVFLSHVLQRVHTACGIETASPMMIPKAQPQLQRVHTACGIETQRCQGRPEPDKVATRIYRLRY